MLSRAELIDYLNGFDDPYLGQNTGEFGNFLQEFSLDNGVMSLTLVLPYPLDAIKDELETSWQNYLLTLSEVTDVRLTLLSKISSRKTQNNIAIQGIKNIIAIGSGKGGVGKSTTAVNLACSLSQLGAKVGLLDADIYGPSVPGMLGTKDAKPEPRTDKRITPIESHGIKTMSIGYLVDLEAALAWRGPMVSGALQQLLNDTDWGELDYLLIDLPPGTGDIQLTLAQKIPVTGAIVVTTPQDVALSDAKRAVSLFQKVNIPVLGIVENMSLHICSKCHHEEAIFGRNGGLNLADQLGVNLLGQLPLGLLVRERSDDGIPVSLELTTDWGQRYAKIALKSAASLARLQLSDRYKFPKISVVNR